MDCRRGGGGVGGRGAPWVECGSAMDGLRQWEGEGRRGGEEDVPWGRCVCLGGSLMFGCVWAHMIGSQAAWAAGLGWVGCVGCRGRNDRMGGLLSVGCEGCSPCMG